MTTPSGRQDSPADGAIGCRPVPSLVTQSRHFFIREIQTAVARYYWITVEQLCSPSRESRFSHPRQIGYWLMRNLPPHRSYPVIARAFGRKDHTTAIHGVKTIEGRRAVDPSTAAAIERIAGALGAPIP